MGKGHQNRSLQSSFIQIYNREINNDQMTPNRSATYSVLDNGSTFVPLAVPTLHAQRMPVSLVATLPTDIIVDVMEYLTPYEQSRVARTCQEFTMCVSEVAKENFLQAFGQIPPAAKL